MNYKNILIIKLSAIGDIVHALPVPYALKKCFPDARITWVVEKTGYDLLTNNPYIDELIIFDKPKFKSFKNLTLHAPAFIKLLRQKRFDLTLDLQGLFKSAAIAALSGAPTRLVYENAREGSRLLSHRIVGSNFKGHIVDRYLDVVRVLGCETATPVFPVLFTPEEKSKAKSLMNFCGIGNSAPYIILALGANWPNKKWPENNFASLCNHIYGQGLVPVAVGSQGDAALFEKLSAAADIPPKNLIGKTSLKELAYIIKQAKAFVGGDTGPMHLAAALNTPVIALMGPTDLTRNGPYGDKHRAIITNRPCAGCWRRSCPENLDCLAAIKVDEVFEAVMERV